MTIKSLELRDAMELTEIYVRRGNTVTVRIQGVGLVDTYYTVEVADGPDALKGEGDILEGKG
jgi:hypothetical protein